ncbi:MAG: 1,4-alpha-glucan branching enzyme [Anaerocolumna sp.]|jgi:1,4-alpha-glucan branching enzyme|nr:1,4-alpha-glucan branching enzyme [Anaerocolumna sp.]
MEEELYDLMDWADIEALIYSEHDNPHRLLGAFVTEKGILINAFIPTAISITVKLKTGQEYPMICEDSEGFYSVLVPGNKVIPYSFFVTYDNNSSKVVQDPYYYEPMIDGVDISKFSNGIHYNIYDKLGAHPITIDGVKGVSFAVWAPNAIRVSVVGNFNNWDGRRHQMRRLFDSGIFELFIPDLDVLEIYKFEIKIKGGLVILKADPYANRTELRPSSASVIWNLNSYQWNDDNWLKKRSSSNYETEPMSVYEVHLGSWKKPDDQGREFYNYREIAPMLASYIKDMGYTHIELMPIMEHPFDASWGYQVTGYYAPTARYGSPDDFMYFIDYMHQEGIGVILDWVPAHFPRDSFGLANFDGTCLYEHLDPRQGSHPHWGTLIYNYGRPQVANFLIANALFWVEKYHVDGIRMDAVASMLYLDYGKKHGEWVANIYGGNENLEVIEMLKHLNSIFKKRKDGTIIIAEESTAWPKITGEVESGGLGFDLKWNLGWMNDFTNYMKCDPLFRKGRHGELTFSMIYAYSEKFMLVLSHDEVVHGKGSMINKMPGSDEQKFANLRAAYGFMMTHPGKKLLFMGQDFAQYSEWSESKSLDWMLLNQEKHLQMKQYVKDLNWLYRQYPSLYMLDFSDDGFEWISCMDADHSIVVFIRKTNNIDETLLIVCNFTPVVYKSFRIGLPFAGKFKEIFNSDDIQYGGSGNINPRLKQSKNIEADGRDCSINITVPPLGISVFTCTPFTDSELENMVNTKKKINKKKK